MGRPQTILQSLLYYIISTLVFSMLAVLVPYIGGYACSPFSCGRFRNISSPFRRQGDPPGCGVQSYELVCTDAKAIIRLGSGTYYVTVINYTGSTFWVIDTNLGLQSSCPLPRWNSHADAKKITKKTSYIAELGRTGAMWATFVNCSRPIKDHGMYRPVACLSTNCSFIYVLTGKSSYTIGNLEPSCHYLAMTPLGGLDTMAPSVPENASYAEVVNFMRNGFSLQFPYTKYKYCNIGEYTELNGVFSHGDKLNNATVRTRIKYAILGIILVELTWARCLLYQVLPSASAFHAASYVGSFIWLFTCIAVIFKFVLAPLAIFTFLAHKYWKTRLTNDAVEKFLRMQQILCGPLRYAYTDITAIIGHFRDKLGQGGYGSVYKGVLFRGNVHAAIKMLNNSKCNGEEFISEVSTIGRIHHVNVVHLVGFCSEEMRRALVYEYMPNGSLDKYIFSSEKSFSWDKLNEIAVGIARGINYLHQGCDMQVLHFDINPHNILLDRNFVPKVANFGLAKLFPRDNTFVPLNAMRGTIGYIAPEMVSRSFGSISSKSDVYSFGMLLLEMAGGRRNADPNVANSSQNYYPSWVYDKLIEQQVGEISIFNMHELERKLCIVGLWCIHMRSHDRPTMSEVIEMLESDINSLEVPSRPFFCDGGEQILIVDSYYLSSELDDIQEEVE